MDEKRFRSQHREVLRDLHTVSRECPAEERLLAWVEERLDTAASARVAEHCALCPSCGELVELIRQPPADVGEEEWREVERRLDRHAWPWRSRGVAPGRPKSQPTEKPEERPQEGRLVDLQPRRALLALAAVLTALVVGLGFWQSKRSPTLPADSRGPQVRGSGLQVLRPVGRVQTIEDFAWTPPVPLPLEYRVEVELDGGEVWRGSTRDQRLVVPPELRRLMQSETQQVMRWRVVGHTMSGEPVFDSGWVELQLESAAVPQPADEPPTDEEEAGGEEEQ